MPIIYHILQLYLAFQTPYDSQKIAAEIRADYVSGEYSLVVSKYEEMSKDSVLISPDLRLKAAHSYFTLGDTARQVMALNEMVYLRSPRFKSAVLNQKALLSAYSGDTLMAINLLKKAIETENTNNFAKQNLQKTVE